MWILILALVALGLVAALYGWIDRRHGQTDEVEKPSVASCATCSGQDPRCEQECMMEAATKEIEYYDDEELDQFRGRPSDGYSDDEAEQFAQVMYTMRPDEVKGWNRSLILREINMPNQIKDEFIALAEECAQAQRISDNKGNKLYDKSV